MRHGGQKGSRAVARVFILTSHSLFYVGVERLLRRETALDVVVGRETDVGEAVGRIKELQPDVVIVDSDHLAPDFAAELMGILRDVGGIKIIGLSLQDNSICIYRGEKRVVEATEDLVEAIELPAV
jgi:DNA-binding NarL/FixJ family response regulator